MRRKKLIIDTDPGIDDAMAILAAFNSEEVEVIGITTIFGNVKTSTATDNAFILLSLAGCPEVPVAEGATTSLKGLTKQHIADFVHGTDGFGNTSQAAVEGRTVGVSAAEWLVEQVTASPGQVSVLALGPLTNIALALQLNERVTRDLAELVILGGAFFVNGNVNPAVEANVFSDPEAADLVFGCEANIRVVGLDVTHACQFTAGDLQGLAGHGRFGTFLQQITRFYLQYHREAYDMEAVYVHDPTALAAVTHPEHFTWRTGPVRVLTEGVARGMTVMDAGLKRWNSPNGWTGRPKVQVAVDVQAEQVVAMLLQRMRA